MINLSIAMSLNTHNWIKVFISCLVSGIGVLAPRIDYPVPGQALQGIVVVTGNTDIIGFISTEISFAYSSHDQNQETGWFLIQQSFEPIQDGTLALWDTTTIADGEYDLRVLIALDSGSTVETVIPSLRVRNYTAIETETPSISRETAKPTGESTRQSSATPRKFPTPFPENPIQFDASLFQLSLVKGVIISVLLLVCLGLYSVVHNKSKKK